MFGKYWRKKEKEVGWGNRKDELMTKPLDIKCSSTFQTRGTIVFSKKKTRFYCYYLVINIFKENKAILLSFYLLTFFQVFGTMSLSSHLGLLETMMSFTLTRCLHLSHKWLQKEALVTGGRTLSRGNASRPALVTRRRRRFPK